MLFTSTPFFIIINTYQCIDWPLPFPCPSYAPTGPPDLSQRQGVKAVPSAPAKRAALESAVALLAGLSPEDGAMGDHVVVQNGPPFTIVFSW